MRLALGTNVIFVQNAVSASASVSGAGKIVSALQERYVHDVLHGFLLI
jgi:hypothetical protein